MTNLPLEPDSQDDITGTSSDAGSRSIRDLPPAVPRWVYAIGIVVLVLIAAIVILHLTGGGFGGHMP